LAIFQKLTIDPLQVLTNDKFFYDNVDWRGWDDRYTYHPGDSEVDGSRTSDQLMVLAGDWYRYTSPPHESDFYPGLGLSAHVYVRNVYEFGGDFQGVDPEGSFDILSLSQYAEWEDRQSGQSGRIHVYELIPEPIANIDDADLAPPYTSYGRDWVIGSLNDDRIAGYAGADRLEGGAGDDILLGDGSAVFAAFNRVRISSPTSQIPDGNDELIGGPGNDDLNGGNGLDVAIYDQTYDSYRVTLGETTTVESLETDEGTDTLVQIERLRFADLKLATDMNGTAGHVVKLLGALFGPSAIDDPHLAGYSVRLFDAGLAADQVAEIGAHALGLGDHQSLCEILWTNIVRTPPQDISVIAPFIDRLSTFEITEGDLILEAANHPLNLANIDFVGLSETGLLYL
jgi:hypothetical protein